MFAKIKDYCQELEHKFDSISFERKVILDKIASFIQTKKNLELPIQLVYICTHNSRRSHFGQVWSAAAAAYYGVKNTYTFSGGTEATAFNPNAIKALKTSGFNIRISEEGVNPIYEVYFGENDYTKCFSKVYNDKVNPEKNFVAIMTCSDAEENCPFIAGAELRISTTYSDPKEFDDKELQDEKYLERSNQIALETLYIFNSII